MRLAKVASVSALALLMLFQPARRADACSCGEFSPSERTAIHDAIFTGKVLSTDPVNPYRWPERIIGAVTGRHVFTPGSARLKVLTVYKGAVHKIQSVDGFGISASCGAEFVKGRTYTVFASMQPSGYLSTGLCDGAFEQFDPHEYFLSAATEPLSGTDDNRGDATPMVIVLAALLPTLAMGALMIVGAKRLLSSLRGRFTNNSLS